MYRYTSRRTRICVYMNNIVWTISAIFLQYNSVFYNKYSHIIFTDFVLFDKIIRKVWILTFRSPQLVPDIDEKKRQYQPLAVELTDMCRLRLRGVLGGDERDRTPLTEGRKVDEFC